MEGPASFATTRWSLVLRAGASDGDADADAHAALEDLCRIYWGPLYVLARRRGSNAADAEDLVQGFLTRLLERRDLATVERGRGTFRGFLATAFTHHVANQRRAERALRRGGGRAPLSLEVAHAERLLAAEAEYDDPERALERSWARLVLERGLERVRARYRDRGKQELFEALEHALAGDFEAHGDVAERLGLSPGAVRVAVHRLRRAYGEALRAEVALTVAGPDEVDAELEALLAALAPRKTPSDP